MEFSRKLLAFRKQRGMTQEQLAEALFVSRTAISKWESGKGYPNIESLKGISKLFGVTIDDLLSGEELISLADLENRSNLAGFRQLIFAFLDIMAVLLIFLPLYGQSDGVRILSVPLPMVTDISMPMLSVYYGGLILLGLMGVTQAIFFLLRIDRTFKSMKMISMVMESIVILFFVLTRQPYVTFMLFMLFLMKMVFLMPKNRR